tara:strand:+ start:3693 stop:4661 length:969 start_codon:yes stop_codon:yes gene_type:complete
MENFLEFYEKGNFNFPLESYSFLIRQLGWNNIDDWFFYWKNKLDNNLVDLYWPESTSLDWSWGVGYPFLTDISQYLIDDSQRPIYGISALPGTGKTTFGKWIENISSSLNLKITVVSLDDFYLPHSEMSIAVKDNPWNVSRGFPGTHSVNLMMTSLSNWKGGDKLKTPLFDKSIRNGFGDRCGWRESNPDLLIIEGWFLGVLPCLDKKKLNYTYLETLTESEIRYRNLINQNLISYQPIWEMINRTWHIKPMKFSFTDKWKEEQEANLFKQRGNSLNGLNLRNFQRMINMSIPSNSFDNIKADVLIKLSDQRKVNWVGEISN